MRAAWLKAITQKYKLLKNFKFASHRRFITVLGTVAVLGSLLLTTDIVSYNLSNTIMASTLSYAISNTMLGCSATSTTTTTLTPTTTTTIAPTTTTSATSTTTTTLTPTTTTTIAPTTTTTLLIPPPTPGESAAYALIEADGGFVSFGGASYFGSLLNKHMPPNIVAGEATTSGKGYWMVNSSGKVFTFGNAKVFGAKTHIKTTKSREVSVTSFSSTKTNRGYWLLKANGGVMNFGDASFCGSAVHNRKIGRAVALVGDPMSTGYWIATSKGRVFAFGTALPYGNAALPNKNPLVAMATTPDGKGYVLLTKQGNVLSFGNAHFYGSPVHLKINQNFVSIAETPDGRGYWVTTARGKVLNYGDARFWGSLTHVKITGYTKVVAIIRDTVTSPINVNIPKGIFGYDVSNFQCKSPGSHLRTTRLPNSTGIVIIEAAGWLDSAYNSCIQSEVAWARKVAKFHLEPYSLYIFLNSPGDSRKAFSLERDGPAGICADLSPITNKLACDAYNYGYNGARRVFFFTKRRHVASRLWWLDIENDFLSSSIYSDFSQGNYWSDSTSLNAQVMQGALDALRQQHVTVGIYSTSIQYNDITGGYAPSGPRTPLWVAGAPWTSPPYNKSGLPKPTTLGKWCGGLAYYHSPHATELFAEGKPAILQETPGNETSPFNLDPDFTC